MWCLSLYNVLPSEKESVCREHGSHLALQASGTSSPPARIHTWVSVLSAPSSWTQ